MKTITMFAIIVISAYIGSFAAITSIQSLTMIAFAKSAKCVSIQTGPDTLTDCGAKNNPLFSAEFKKQCREVADKCSSSQTGFGTEGNFVKK